MATDRDVEVVAMVDIGAAVVVDPETRAEQAARTTDSAAMTAAGRFKSPIGVVVSAGPVGDQGRMTHCRPDSRPAPVSRGPPKPPLSRIPKEAQDWPSTFRCTSRIPAVVSESPRLMRQTRRGGHDHYR